jgi:hypothetical protein
LADIEQVALALQVYKALDPDFDICCGEMDDSEQLILEKIPSAFQIRIAGVKGVVTVWPTEVMKRLGGGAEDLLLRGSMIKFRSNYLILEVRKKKSE